ncbi:thioesterase II family protein [Chitinophaga sp. Hz27]|uniref:thioesterase II family protein n=1 Tax=Chitinophaga sp. Hz27 TaxID=3347169 RepID=UPI0035D77E11
MINLITLPYAGGNKFAYNALKPLLSRNITLVPMELPGRGQRMNLPLLGDLQQMADDLMVQVSPYIRNEYMFYGHSMGGTLGNLLIHRLKAGGRRLPLHFLVTGCAAPKVNHLRAVRHKLPDRDLRDELRALGGLPEEVLNNQALMEFFLPIIREDMRALEMYQYKPLGKYDVPLTIVNGTSEPISDDMAAGWADETTIPPDFRRMEGDHFFILQHFAELAAIINHQTARISIV